MLILTTSALQMRMDKENSHLFLKTEEFSSHRIFFCSTIDFRTPSELFSQKRLSSLFNRGTVFLVCLLAKDIKAKKLL